MSNKAVELNVAGQSCRVVTTADEKELRELARMVEDKLEAVLGPGRPVTTQAMLLAAVALANDVREQQARADAIAERAKKTLRTLLHRVDHALAIDERDDGSAPARPATTRAPSGNSGNSGRAGDSGHAEHVGRSRQPGGNTHPPKKGAARKSSRSRSDELP